MRKSKDLERYIQVFGHHRSSATIGQHHRNLSPLHYITSDEKTRSRKSTR
jgi:hypothetical protein